MLISPQSAPAFHAVEGLARAVSEAEGLDDILAVALDALQGLIGAHRASVLLADDDGVMRFRGWRGLSDGYRAAVEGHSPWPADVGDPQPILIEDVSQADLGHLGEVAIREGIGALGFVPLVYRKRLIGKFMLCYDAPHVVTPGRLMLARTVARLVGLAVGRFEGEVAQKRARDEQQFLLDAAEALSSSLDLDSTLRRITELAVPRLADGAVILMRGAPPDQATVWHRDPTVVQRIAHGGPDHLADLKSLGIGSWVVVPLRGRREPIGTITLMNGPERAPLDEHDLALLRELADRAAAAIENARLYRELRESQERLATTLRSIGDAVVTTDTAGRVSMLNPVAEELLGWSQAEACGRAVQDVFVLRPGSRAEHPVSAALSGGSARTTRRPAVVVARDGTEREIAHTTAPIRGRDALGAVLVFRDVTGEKRVEAELARASKLESLGVLAGGIAHDFNNVLTAITANLSIAERRLAPGDAARERIATAGRAAERARDLTNQLLTFARGGAPVKASTSIDQIIRDSVSFALQGARSRAEVELPRDLWAVDADAGQIGQVLHNLVLNADQAMPTGGIVRVDAANVTIAAGTSLPLAPGEYVRIRVRDQGVGIPAEHISRIFDPFFTTRPQGTGLGLATSYSIVHRHAGHLAVRSEEGKGATFCLWLPRAWAEPEIGTEEEAAAAAMGGRVLVMDDDAGIRELAGDCLRELGYRPSFALDGREAVDRYEAAVAEGRPFDAVILDLTVPGGMGGREAMAVLRERWPAARVIVSSGYSNDPVIARYREQGFAGVLQKPYRVDDVARALAAALDDAEPLRGGPAPGLVSPGGAAG